MQGTIAQLLSLVAHGNKYLSDGLDDNYFPGSIAFKFCKFVKFVDLENSGDEWVESDFAPDPIAWFQNILDSGVIQLRARNISTDREGLSDRMSVAFAGGGGRWLIETASQSTSDFWEANWEVGDRDDPDQNIWRVKYGRIVKNANEPEQPLPSVSDVKAELKEVLQKISKFAHNNNCSNFGKWFDSGIKALSKAPSKNGKGYNILPDNYATSEHHQLVDACQSAWVFGGMGSWNDMGFSDDEVYKKYEELSDKLFNLINLALLVACNPSTRPKQPHHSE